METIKKLKELKSAYYIAEEFDNIPGNISEVREEFPEVSRATLDKYQGYSVNDIVSTIISAIIKLK